MGRSVPTYRMKLEELIAELAPYRRALREQDRAAFDALMNRARRYASAAGYQAAADPMETAMLSMLLGIEKEMEQMKGALENMGGLGNGGDGPKRASDDGNRPESGQEGRDTAADGAKTIDLGGDDGQKGAP